MSEKYKQMVARVYKNKVVIIIAALAVLYTLIGFLLLPFLIERHLPGMLGKSLNCEVSLGEVKINPFAMTLEAREFQMKEPSGRPIAGLERLYVNFQLSSLFRWALTFDEVFLDAPSINIIIESDGKVNLARLAGQETAAPAQKEESKPLRLLLRNIEINQGRIDFTDNRQAEPASVSFYPLNIRLADISTIPDREGPYTLTATSTDGAILKWSGQVSLEPLWSEGSLGFERIALSTPWKFFRSSLNIASPEGSLGVTTRYLFDYSKDAPVFTLNDLSVKILDLGLQIEGAEKPFLTLPEISLGAGELDLMQRRIDAVRMAIRGGALDLVMDKDGVLNLQMLTSRETEAETTSPSSATSNEKQAPWLVNIPEFKLENLAINYTDRNRAQAVSYSTDNLQLVFNAAINTDAPGMQVQINGLGLTLKQIEMGYADGAKPLIQVGSMAVTGGSFDLAGRSVSVAGFEVTDGSVNIIRQKDNIINLARLFVSDNPAPKEAVKEAQAAAGEPWRYVVESISLSGFKAQISDLTVKPDSPLINIDSIRLSASRFDGKSPFPFEAGLHVVQGGDLSASGSFDPSGAAMDSMIAVKDLALPVSQPYLSMAAPDLTLTSGMFSTKGAFNRTSKGGITYKGDVGIAALKIIENSTKDTLIGWEQLKTPDLRYSMDPNSLEMDTLKLIGLEGKFIISEDKKVNIVEAFKSKDQDATEPQPKESSPAPAAETPGNSFPVRVGRLSLENGIMDFADLSLRPQFATKIHELKGVVIGISSSPGARTQMELDGRVDEYGTSNIKGEINSFDPKEFTDISVVFKNVEMTNLTPYSGKFAGYEIDYGKLSLDLQYKIKDSKLLGENKIIIDTLKLGKKVDSPDAVKLPLKLAVAILKDANGVIDLDLPVSGDLNDPEFRYGPIIWKAIVNLLTKIVTSPFRALGALFGGDEELLNTVSFEAGKGNIPPPEQEKLVRLLEALRQRPQLKLIVTGRYNSQSDGQAIRQLQVRRSVSEAMGMQLEAGEDPGPVDFSNPQSREKLKEMLINRYGQEAYDVLNPAAKPVDEKAKTKKAKKKSDAKQADKTQVSEDPGELAKRLFSDLVKREQVELSVLKQLADKRAQAIVTQMTAADGLQADRVMIKPSEGTSDDGIPASLDLDAMD
jgi:hypothetical protein